MLTRFFYPIPGPCQLGAKHPTAAASFPVCNNGAKADAKAIAAHYAGFGEYRGLVLWMDIMRHNTGAA